MDKLENFLRKSFNKGKGCGQPAADLNADAFSKLQAKGVGPPMNANERCKSGGYNVTDGSTYVDRC